MALPIKVQTSKECSNYWTTVLILHASKVMLKSLQDRLQQYPQELWDVPAGFRKGRGTKDQIANIPWIIERNSRRTSTSVSLTTLKLLIAWITTNCGKFLNRWEYQTTLPVSWETCMQVKKQVRTGHGTTDWFKIGKWIRKGYILLLWLFNLYTEHIGVKCQAEWITVWIHSFIHSHQPHICRRCHSNVKKWRAGKELFDKSERRE